MFVLCTDLVSVFELCTDLFSVFQLCTDLFSLVFELCTESV